MACRRRFARPLLILVVSCSFSSLTLADDPPLDPKVAEEHLKERREYVQKLDDWVQSRRAEIKLQMTDFVAAQQAVVANARKEVEIAEKATKDCRYQLAQYRQGTYLQDKATAKGAILLAKSDLEQAIDRRKDLDEKARRGVVEEVTFTVADLDVQQAKFSLEQAEMELSVLEKYTKEKQTKIKQAAIDSALAIEVEKKGLLEVEEAKERRLRERATAFRVRSPEDLVIALIDDAVKNEDKALGIVAEARKLEARIRDQPNEAATLNQQLSKQREEAVALMNQAKSQLLEASTLGEQVSASRKQLLEAERQLKKERELLEILEAQLTPKK